MRITEKRGDLLANLNSIGVRTRVADPQLHGPQPLGPERRPVFRYTLC